MQKSKTTRRPGRPTGTPPRDLRLRREVGNRIRKARKSLGHTLAQVAEQLDVSRSIVSQWESGQSYPGPENLVALLALYSESADWMLGVEVSDTTDRRRDTMRALAKVPENQLQFVQDVLALLRKHPGSPR